MENTDKQQQIDEIIKSALGGLKNVTDIKTNVGSPIKINENVTLLPIIKTSIGFVAGGGEMSTINKCKQYPFMSGSGSGVTVAPLGFVVINKDNVSYICCTENDGITKTINIMTSFINDFIGDKDDKNKKDSD